MSEDRVNRRYHEMGRDERIEDSDRIAVMALMNELTRSKRKRFILEFESLLEELSKKYKVRFEWKR